MITSLGGSYETFYRARDPKHVYPAEFVVRAFLGSYPRLPSTRLAYVRARVLDVGFGDGRNMPLLSDLGMSVYGVEISDEICARTAERMRGLGVAADLRVGSNSRLPFDAEFFDHVVACHFPS